MDKLERLLNLTAALLAAERPLSADELKERVGGYPDDGAAQRRAFERDKKDLRAMGIPLIVEKLAGTDPPVEGYRIRRDDYAGADLRLEPSELAALHLATNLVRLDGDDTALLKLGRVGEEPDREVGRVPFDDALATLIGAAAERQAVSFLYSDTDRVVEPWRLSFAHGHWYLAGFDRVRDGERLYRVDRIRGPVVLKGRAEMEAGSGTDPRDLRGWELGTGIPQLAKLMIDPAQAVWARHILSDLEELPDGGVIATLEVRNVEAFRSFVLTFLEHAEVLEPAELRGDIIEWIEALT